MNSQSFYIAGTALWIIVFSCAFPTPVNGSEARASTNVDWLCFSVSIPKTNIVAGEAIAATVTVSNCLSEAQRIHWEQDRGYAYDFGYFLVVDLNTGKQIPHKTPPSEYPMPGITTQMIVPGHQAKVCIADLVDGHSLTNAGTYSISAIEWMPPADGMRHFLAITSPPIILYVFEKSTNKHEPYARTNSAHGAKQN